MGRREAPPLAAWLPEQRWFRSKRRIVDTVTEVDRAAIGRTAALAVLEVAYLDGGPTERYLVPTVDGGGDADGHEVWSSIVDAIGRGAELPAANGRFVCAATGALAIDRGLDVRELAVEQSNTSVVVGERLILKLFRLLEPGDNPDLEVSAFLGAVGFADTPALAGSMVYEWDEGRSAAAMLQAYIPTRGDGWTAMLSALASDPAAAVTMAGRIGEVTAALHAALASRPDDPAFPARRAAVPETAAWRASAERQLAQAVGAVGGHEHERLVELAPRLRARFADAFGAATGDALVTRIHGDYHLGQLLARPDGGFCVIDFEGEPARPLAERREPSSPLRDVAGMLRSLDYAARTAARASAFDADGWLAKSRAALLDGYGGIPPASTALLDAFELEKACYEIRYEANARPAWLWLPLGAVERLAAA